MNTTRKVAVTAASGRLGHAILRKLARDLGPDAAVGIARSPGKIEVPGIERRRGDYQSVAEMTAALAGVDTVILISAPVTPGTERVGLHRNVIAAAKQAGVRKLIFTSVIGNGLEAGTLFESTQAVNRQAESDLAASGLEWIVARNGLYLELDLGHIIAANSSGGVYSNPGGSGRCGYITIDELAEGTAKLAIEDRCNGQIVNLIGETLTQSELVQMASEVFGLDVHYQPISVEANIARFMADARIAARGLEVAQMLTGCFQCIERGAMDVESDFERAAGRPPKPVRQQMEEYRQRSQS
jgi:NAD(P)H dehydrogenase (quinone)